MEHKQNNRGPHDVLPYCIGSENTFPAFYYLLKEISRDIIIPFAYIENVL